MAEKLPGVDNKYNFQYFKFPNDLTQPYNNHYMVIQINVPTRIDTGRSDDPKGYFVKSSAMAGEFSKVDQLNIQSDAAYVSTTSGYVGGVGNTRTVNLGSYDPLKYVYTRGTRRISDAIALFMPTPIIYNTLNDYEEIKLTQLFGQGIAALAGSWAGRQAAATGASIDAAREAATSASGMISSGGNVVGRASQMFGYPINPRVEVLFSNTKLRQYVFEFLMAPTSEEESKTIENIIRTLRFHAAPELAVYGTFFIPPAELDITFYHNGKENTVLPRINTCVIDRIEVDYTPQQGQFTAFSNGYPVTTRLSLGLREVEVIHKKRVYEGF